MKFYSGNGVDEFIAPLLPEFGYAVDVGANDGIFFSNTLHFEEKGWYVLCIEPNPRLREAGLENRKLWLPLACGSQNDVCRFTICGKYPYASESGLHPGTTYQPQETVAVPIERLDQILAFTGFPRLDLLSIDTEGHDLEVLKGSSLRFWKPTIVVAEAMTSEAGEALDRYMDEQGYSFLALKEFDHVFKRR